MRHVLAQALLASVIQSDDQHGRNRAFADEAVCSFIHLPLDTGERGRRLEQVLAIVQIQDGIGTRGVLRVFVTGWKPDAHEASIAKNTALKFM